MIYTRNENILVNKIMGSISKILIAIGAIFFVFLLSINSVAAQRGCCSHHGGVSHCDTSTGKKVCNDGTYSPSCTCQYIPPKPVTPPKPVCTTKNEIVPEEIPFETREQKDPNLEKGTKKVIQEGINGTKETTFKLTICDGKETDREQVSETITQESVPEIIAMGTKEGEVLGDETKDDNATTKAVATVAGIGGLGVLVYLARRFLFRI